MKTKLFFCMASCIIAAMFTSSCSKSSDSEEDLQGSLIGYWESDYMIDDAYVGLRFDEGGTGMTYFYKHAVGTTGTSFTSIWSAVSNVLSIYSDGSTTTYTYSISGNTMQITYNGRTHPFSRETPRVSSGTGGSGTGGSSGSHKYTLDHWQTIYDGYEQNAITAYNDYHKATDRFKQVLYKSNFEMAQINMISTSAKATADGWTLTESEWQTKKL